MSLKFKYRTTFRKALLTTIFIPVHGTHILLSNNITMFIYRFIYPKIYWLVGRLHRKMN